MTDEGNENQRTRKGCPEQPDDTAFQRTLEDMLKTPHKPHTPVAGREVGDGRVKKGREPKPAPKP